MTAEWKPTHRHTKRGTTYVIVGQALLQASEPVSENTILTVYRGENGDLWCRPIREFDDGRFEALCSPANILALTKRVEKLETENARLRAANDPNHYSRTLEAAIAEDGP